MIEGIANDCILSAKDGFKKACVGVESTREQNAILKLVVFCDNSLQILMNVLSPTDKPHRTHAESMGVKRFLSCLNQPRVVRET